MTKTQSPSPSASRQGVKPSTIPARAASTAENRPSRGDQLLFLTDEQIRRGVELMFFAYRAFTRDPDDILREHGYGRAHHRALHFIGTRRDLTVAQLLEILGVTKQSLNRVLRELVAKGLVEQRVGEVDRRQRRLRLTDAGIALEKQLADAQRARMRRAYREAGPEAVAGFRTVLERMMDAEMRDEVLGFVAGQPEDRRSD